jgi:phage portal protein BeeE
MVMSEWEGTAWAGSEPIQTREDNPDSLAGLVARMSGFRTNPWRLPTIEEAMGVPSILRSVSLISNTTASLTIQAFRNSDLIDRLPAVIARPHPYHTPGEFYGMSTFDLASAGECVWWIASRDFDGYASALVPVPLGELSITENERNRLFPVYEWGNEKGTRYSSANPRGEFVHVFWLPRAGRLRGKGPLQYAKAAASVAIEAQEAAANFYAEGGNPSLVIKHAGQLSPERRDPDTYEIVTDPDETGYNEAELLRNQWMGKPHNVPRVIDQTIESVEYMQPNEHGAQMLDTRDYSNGDAARMFGIPGALLEYGVAGASLTYQNIESVWTNFVRGCLSIGYLEKIEQALSDLLPRSTVARFLTEGLQRADEKSRWEIYQLAVAVLGIEEAGQMARVREGLVSGNPEVAAILPAPPAAIPASLPEVRTAVAEIRCTRQTPKRRGGITKLERCNRLLSTSGSFVGQCPRCKAEYEAVA